MMDVTKCDHNRLRQLLDGDLAPAVETELTLHLETCAVCRHDLESFAADETWWQGTRDALSNVSDQDDDRSFELADGFADRSTVAIPLDFLSKSDNPAMLGRLGEFEILEPIGCGGMGIVLKGYDHELNRYVAVKVLHPYCATSAAARKRFAREAQAAAAVVHQHVVPIYAVEPNHHPPYLVMPFVPGESLQQRMIRQGPFDVIDVLRVGQQVAEGLAAAHAQGLVHRDIKPGNILLERNVERIMITDFGLARAADDASLTQSGVIAGTPQFMSPEQTRGDLVDHRTDLFSLGTVMYTLLAGHSPFRAETALGVLRRVCDDKPRSLREINPTVPLWLEACIAKLHAKHPNDRFESAAQVADLLKNCIAHLQQPTLVALPAELIELEIPPPARRRTHLRLIVGIVGLMLVALSLFAANAWRADVRHKTISVRQNEMAVPGNEASTAENEWDDDYRQEAQAIDNSIKRIESESADEF